MTVWVKSLVRGRLETRKSWFRRVRTDLSPLGIQWLGKEYPFEGPSSHQPLEAQRNSPTERGIWMDITAETKSYRAKGTGEKPKPVAQPDPDLSTGRR